MAESIACFETEYGVSGMVREKKIPMNQFLSEEQRSSRSGAYHQRFYQYIRKLGFHLYSSCHVLLRIFHYHWMGTLRSQMCGVPF